MVIQSFSCFLAQVKSGLLIKFGGFPKKRFYDDYIASRPNAVSSSIGGVLIGCRHRLTIWTELGLTDVVVLERDKLTSGTPWQCGRGVVPAVLGVPNGNVTFTCMGAFYRRAGDKKPGRQHAGREALAYIQPADTPERVRTMRPWRGPS